MSTTALVDEVRRTGVDVGTLTDEEFRLLLMSPGVEVTETGKAALDAAARGLVARGWANAVDGRLELSGGAAAVKQASLLARSTIQVSGVLDGAPYEVTVVSLGGGVVLVERREAPGVRHYRIDTAARARAALVRELAPEAPEQLPGEEYDGTDPAMTATIEAARGRLVVLASRAGAEQATVFFSASAVVDRSGFTWLGTMADGRLRYRPVDRAALRTVLADWVLEEATVTSAAGA